MMGIIHKLNDKSKAGAKWFFIETRFGIWMMASMALLNAIEGIIHLVVAIIGMWGAIDINVYDIRIWLPIVENFVLGLFSLLTGWCLGLTHSHHHKIEGEEN